MIASSQACSNNYQTSSSHGRSSFGRPKDTEFWCSRDVAQSLAYQTCTVYWNDLSGVHAA